MSDEIERLPADEVDGAEGWQRLTDDPDVRGIEAVRHDGGYADGDGGMWQVIAFVAEFLRVDDLEVELGASMIDALVRVPGVTAVEQEDREVWIVSGSPSGDALVRAAAAVVDDLAPRARAYIDGLD